MMKGKYILLSAVMLCALGAPTLAVLPDYTDQTIAPWTFEFISVVDQTTKMGEVISAVYFYDDTSLANADYYLYTYQLTNLTTDFSWFSVGLLPDVVVTECDVDSTGVDPVQWNILPSSVEAAFFSNPVGVGETSSVLWFKSPSAPNPNNGIGAMSGYSAAGFAFAQGHLFAPVPEPLTVTLLGFGWLAMRSFRRK